MTNKQLINIKVIDVIAKYNRIILLRFNKCGDILIFEQKIC